MKSRKFCWNFSSCISKAVHEDQYFYELQKQQMEDIK